MVGPGHSAATPAVRLFGKTPAGSEPTGITFSPDYKFLFISIQHPNVANSATQLDAGGNTITWNQHSTLVISRVENLGPLATLPLTMENFDLKEEAGKARLNWSVVNAVNHAYFDVDRSLDGRNFEHIFTDNRNISSGASQTFEFTDKDVPVNTVVYYRIKQVDNDGSFHYSETKSIKVNVKGSQVSIYPIPVIDKLTIEYVSDKAGNITINMIDAMGRKMISEKRTVSAGKNILKLDVQKLGKGNYTLDLNGLTNEHKSYQVSKL